MPHASPTDPDVLFAQSRWVRALALQLVRDAAAADDVVQEALLAAWRRKPDERAPLKPWLARVVRSQAAMRARTDARRRERESIAARPDELPSSSDLAARAEVQKQLVECVLELREPYRGVVLLRYFDGKEPTAIAAQRGVPPSTVRNQLSRALEELRERLDARHGGRERDWALALLPLAVEASAATKTSGLVGAITSAHVALKLALAAATVVIAASLSIFGCERKLERDEVVARAVDQPEERLESGVRAAVETPEPEVLEIEPSTRVALGEAKRLAVQRLRGKVIDAQSKEPLADFVLTIADGTRAPEALTTNAQGEFESALEYEKGELAVELIDRAGTDVLLFDRGRFVSANPTPTVRVDWDGKRALVLAAEDIATVLVQGLDPLEGGGWRISHGDRWCSGNASFSVQRAWLRSGAPPWVRLRGLDLRDNESVLYAVRADGLRRAQGMLSSNDHGGRRPTVVFDETDAARLEVTLVREGQRDCEGAEVSVLAVKTNCQVWADTRWSGGEMRDEPNATRFEFLGLPLHFEYEIAATALGCRESTKTVNVKRGEVERVTIKLRDSHATSFLRGALTSRSGAFRDDVVLTFTPLFDSQLRPKTLRIPAHVERGAYRSEFSLPEIDSGAYAVEIRTPGHGHRRWSAPAIVEAPASDLGFVCIDDEPLVDIELSVVDDETRAPLQRIVCQYTIDGVEYEVSGDGVVRIAGVSRESDVRWCVTTAGYGVECGDWDDVVETAGRAFAEPRLKRGWAAKVRTVFEDTRIPLADVEIEVDGELVGRTDERGVLFVTRLRAPREIVGKHEGCAQVEGGRKLGAVVDANKLLAVFVLPFECR